MRGQSVDGKARVEAMAVYEPTATFSSLRVAHAALSAV